MKTFYGFIFIFISLAAFYFITGKSRSSNIIDPQIIAQQEEIQRKMEESGYADIELDLLHEKLQGSLSKLRPLIKKDKDNQSGLTLPIAYGESIKSISERYLYSGDIILYTDDDGKKLLRVKLVFNRSNPLGRQYKLERRELENPTPNFTEKNETLDKNDDMILRYFETDDDQKEFTKIDEMIVGKMQFFTKRVALLETYKKYLRRAEKMLIRKIYDLELSERVRVQKMLEFE